MKMATSDGHFDELFLKILNEGNNHVSLFLEEVFGFLYRRTNFYVIQSTNDENEAMPDVLAKRIIDTAYRKYKIVKDSNDVNTSGKDSSTVPDTSNDGEQVDHSYAQEETKDAIEMSDIIEHVKLNHEDQENNVKSDTCEQSVKSSSPEPGEIATIIENENNESFAVVADTLRPGLNTETIPSYVYINDILLPQENSSPEICGSENSVILLSLDEVMAYIQDYEKKTNTHFIQQKKDAGFSRSFWNKNSRIQWQFLSEKSVPINFDSIPFVFLGEFVLECHRGRAKASQRFRREMLSQDASIKMRLSKKVNCPAKIYVKKIVKFPQFRTRKNTEHYKDLISKRLRTELQNNKLLKVQIQYHVRTPDVSEHQNHDVGDLDYQKEKLKHCTQKTWKKEQSDPTVETIKHLPITQEALEQLILQQSEGDQPITVVFDTVIETGESSSVFLQTLSSENMDIA